MMTLTKSDYDAGKIALRMVMDARRLMTTESKSALKDFVCASPEKFATDFIALGSMADGFSKIYDRQSKILAAFVEESEFVPDIVGTAVRGANAWTLALRHVFASGAGPASPPAFVPVNDISAPILESFEKLGAPDLVRAFDGYISANNLPRPGALSPRQQSERESVNSARAYTPAAIPR